MLYAGYSAEEAARFCEHWLPAWTGNDPERLASFYSEDAFYRDGSTGPAGLTGKSALLAYFRKLLRENPRWTWIHLRATALPDGFLNYWEARIPVAEELIKVQGVCVVQLREGLIYRNEVFFDRHELLVAIERTRRKQLQPPD